MVELDLRRDVAGSSRVSRGMATELKQSAPGNVPVELSSFVGRGRELAEIKRLLASARTITLTGPGGIGKSRLALRTARKLERHFRDGVWWVELAELESPDLPPYALARSLGVQERHDAGGIDTALLAHLRDRRLLLVLDNCEHLIDACRQLVAFVTSECERVRIICTSRERLGVPGEAVVVLSALDVPPNGERLSVDRLVDVDALRLLVDRAIAVAPDFVLTDENSHAASEICRRLDGLPLAIELAAVRLASMTTDDLRERLDDRLRLLAVAHRPGPERRQTLRATVDWSYELLSAQEQILWRRLSVFAGSFGLEAAEDVCTDKGLERERIVDLIASLVAKSILVMSHEGRRGRYRLLETLRLYGAQRLAEAGEEVELARRHAAWYAALISGGDRPWWGSPRQGEMYDVLEVEWANVEAALDFCIKSMTDAEMGLRMATDLWLYWLVRGRYRAGSARLRAFLTVRTAPSPARAMALWASGFLLQARGEYASALAAVEEARRVCDQNGGDRELAYALHGLGLVHLRLGDVRLAAGFAARSRERMQVLDDPMGLAVSTFFLATVAAAARQLPDARRLARDTLRASEQAGDMMIRGISHGLLGTVEWQSGDAPAAEASLKEAVRIQGVIGHRWGMLNSLEGLAWVAGSCEQLERAALLLGAGAALSEELGITLFPHLQVHHDACEAAAREGLGDARYGNCWDLGYALAPAQVLAAALDDASPTHGPAPAASPHDPGELSARELEVARLVANGMSNPAIAADLFVSVATVKTHVSHILGKLGLNSRVQLASWVAAHDAGAQTRTEQ
jgi:predicted ATPase/DNA-binding CsgD family transcriptional regulator